MRALEKKLKQKASRVPLKKPARKRARKRKSEKGLRSPGPRGKSCHDPGLACESVHAPKPHNFSARRFIQISGSERKLLVCAKLRARLWVRTGGSLIRL